MPWSQTSPMDQRTPFSADYLRETLSVTELCDLYRVSRKTAYKWIDRYLRHGPAGLQEHSRRPQHSPNATAEDIVEALLAARRRHPSWGGKKLLALLHKRNPSWDLPHRSTVCDLLKRHGMVPSKRHRRRIGHPGKPTSAILAPNDLWSADFKCQFKTGNGRYCYPLTVADGFSRYLLGCQGLSSTAVDEANPVFTRLFKEYGLPRASALITACPLPPTPWRDCHGSRLGGSGSGSCRSSSNRGNPQQNGRHERMHRTLKAETTRPAAGSLAPQQRRFNAFRNEFNTERPHEALDQQTPASWYRPSTREMPSTLPPLEYPDRFEVRYVSANGGIRWNRDWVHVSIVCVGEYVGLEEIDNGIWTVYFGPLKLGRLIERHMRIEDEYGRLNRKTV